ncbi:cupin domain-containing protein [Oscillochloris sp. ZM17-4]|uniref:cupin domain-containing protein n=1 Tax=Oscillochloris sp. ZM17-4 TaxID=2866714 RepID=UPI001C73BBD1|nr:cupin domain-containing protein [Oscillochloris sp. ZM17-4]MBX0328179.1 cupin domain-containing protein [Oscillochloris sp. ZM17-4]
MRKTTGPSLSARDLHAPEAHDTAPAGIIDVGSRLRTLREARQLSIRALAEMSGLAVNTLSLIENGKTSPSVSTLQQIVVALGIPISTFFEAEQPRSRLVFLKTSQQQMTALTHGTLADLGAGMSQRRIEPLLITLEQGAGSGPQLIAHPGQEFILCLEGRVTYTVEGQRYELDPGDSLLFDSTMPHSWENTEELPARALLVLCP